MREFKRVVSKEMSIGKRDKFKQHKKSGKYISFKMKRKKAFSFVIFGHTKADVQEIASHK